MKSLSYQRKTSFEQKPPTQKQIYQNDLNKQILNVKLTSQIVNNQQEIKKSPIKRQISQIYHRQFQQNQSLTILEAVNLNELEIVKLKEKYEQLAHVQPYYKETGMIEALKKSMSLLDIAQQNQKIYQKNQKEMKSYHQKQIRELEEQIKNQEERVKNYLQIKREYENTLETNQKLLNELDIKKLEVLNKEHDNLQIEKKLLDQKTMLDQQINNQNKQIIELTNKNEQLNEYQSKYEESFNLGQQLKETLQKKENEIKQQKNQIEVLQSDFSSFKKEKTDELNNKKKELNEIQSKYEESLSLGSQLKQTLSERENEIQQQNNQFGKLESDFLNFKQNSENEQTKLNQEKTNLNDQLNNQKKQIDELIAKNIEFIQYKPKYEESQNQNQQLKSALQEKEREILEQKNQNAQLLSDLENLKLIFKQQNVKRIFEQIFAECNQNGDLNQQAQKILEQLNPQIEITKNLVEFTKSFIVIEQNQPSEQEKTNLKVKNDEMVQQFQQQKVQQSKQAQFNPMMCLLVLQNMYLQEKITTFITDQPIKSLEEDKSYQIQQQYLQVGLHNQTFYFSATINNQSSLYKILMDVQAKQDLNKFISYFKDQVGKAVNSSNPQQDVNIVSVSYNDMPQIDFKVYSKQLDRYEIKKKMTFEDIGLSISEKNLLQNSKLSVDMFSPQFNQEWGENFRDQHTIRGQLQFYNQTQPVDHQYYFPVGYKGYALNVDRYGDDLSWISMNADSKTWIVLFHGTQEKAIEGIVKDKLAPGIRNLYGGSMCRITNTKIKEGGYANVYLTNDSSIAEQYAKVSSMYDGKQFLILFQCRVNPQGVKSPKAEENFYTVEDNLNIRPYRILLKEC
ncbi:hypothetical protein ABPG74_003272 [Tetrahymena malaccensis]